MSMKPVWKICVGRQSCWDCGAIYGTIWTLPSGVVLCEGCKEAREDYERGLRG